MISLEHVTKKYTHNTAVDNVSFSIKEGELVFITGPSGCGKSTILQLIASIEKASSGNIIVNDIDITNLSAQRRRMIRQYIGFIFQDHKILFNRSVFDNVRLPLDILGYNKSDIKDELIDTLEQVGLYDKIHYMPQELSGGEQQRLCIARAIVHSPKIVIADEPTANLDRDNALRIIELLLQLCKLGMTVIIAAHDKSILDDYGTRILNMKSGQLSS